MATNYTNFYYDPVRNGYDSSMWHTLYGLPSVVSNQLVLNEASCVHFADIYRGQFTFNVNIPVAPTAGQTRSFGLYGVSRDSYIIFNISDTVFSAKTSDGVNSSSSVITWDSAWTATNLEFSIRWEGGTAKFFVNGNQMAAISDISVPGHPLSLYASNNTFDDMTIKYIEAQGIQTYLMTVGPEDSSFQPVIVMGFKSDTVTITESTTFLITILYPSTSDTVTVSESVTMLITQLYPEMNDTATVTENVALTVA